MTPDTHAYQINKEVADGLPENRISQNAAHKQELKILVHMVRLGKITRRDALLRYGIANLTAVINNIHKRTGITDYIKCKEKSKTNPVTYWQINDKYFESTCKSINKIEDQLKDLE